MRKIKIPEIGHHTMLRFQLYLAMLHKLLLIPCLLLTLIVSAQWNEGVIIKIRPLNWLISRNYGVEIEKGIGQFSASAEYNHIQTWWLGNGSEGIAKLSDANGYRVGVSGKYYFQKLRDTPFGWFTGITIRQQSRAVKNFEQQDFHGEHLAFLNLKETATSVYLVIGKQFEIWRFTTEMASGVGFVTGKNTLDQKDGAPIDRTYVYPEKYFRPSLYLNWTVGFTLYNPDKVTTSQ